MGVLYVVPTPIGNLEDISFRAIRILKEVHLILAEDTRQTGKLLKHYDISNPLRAFHQHNEHKKLEEYISLILSSGAVALVSDAGTPGISDPGFLLIRECIKQGIEVISIPGATAAITALVGSGMPCDRFVFEGFLPQKKGRQSKIKQLSEEERTIVLYESPHRLLKLMEEIKAYISSERKVVVARELTKVYEEYVRGTPDEIILHFQDKAVKGEIVVIIEGN